MESGTQLGYYAMIPSPKWPDSFNLTVSKIREDLLITVGGTPVSNEEVRQHSVDRESPTYREAFGLESPATVF